MQTRAGKPEIDAQQVMEATREMLAPFERADGESPYQIHRELEETMQNYVGIFRNEDDLKKGLGRDREIERTSRRE